MQLSDDAISTIYDLIGRVQEGERESNARNMTNGTGGPYRSELYHRAEKLRQDILKYEQDSIKEKK